MKQVLVGVLVLGAGSLGLAAQAPPAAKATVKLSPTANQTARGEVTFTAESGGVHVVGTESAPDNVDQTDATPADTSSHLPFRDQTFDVVLDRHSSYWPSLNSAQPCL
jgi:hypothetical protein